MGSIIQERKRRTEWFLHDRLGLFIHWGLYAIPARGEWVRQVEKISVADYQKYFNEFNPTRYNPQKWALAAKQAGMRYAVITAKHHDGFCLFDSKLTDYKSTNTKAKKDLVREYVESFRAEGIKVGLYYSLIDWHHEHYTPDNEAYYPMSADLDRLKPRDFLKYVNYFHGQVRELLTEYGKIDIMWFDFSYFEKTGETWKSTELINMVRSLQPDIIIDNRLEALPEHGGQKQSIRTKHPQIYAGDFASPEQVIPSGGIADEDGDPIPWEACMTLNNHWGYSASDLDYKSPKQIVRAIVECVSKNGNLILNVGPDAKGEIPEKSLEVLAEVGKWMEYNGDSIYGCKCANFGKPEWGRYTKNGNKLYAHIYDRGIGPVSLIGLNGKVKNARLLADGSEVNLGTPWYITDFPDDTFLDLKGQQLPDELDTVVELELI